MSDFLSQQQCDELVNGQTYNGEYVPTDQDLADMNEAWDLDNLDFNGVMGYDRHISNAYYDDYPEMDW